MKIQACKHHRDCQECDRLLARSEKRLVDNGLHYCFSCRDKLRAKKGAGSESSKGQMSKILNIFRRWPWVWWKQSTNVKHDKYTNRALLSKCSTKVTHG